MSLSTKTLIVKVTNDCNFSCKYCLLEKNVPKHKIISKEIIRRLFEQLQNNLDTKEITVIWHGGEPLLAGINFFEEMMEIEKEYQIKFINETQTNGSLITDEYAAFFQRNKFQVGLSIDGPKKFNDLTRFDRANQSTFSKAINGIKILKKHNVPVGGMATISKYNIKYPNEIYTFFKQNELPFQFNPLYYSGNANENLNSLSISPEEYTKFKIELGEIWLRDSNPLGISVFEEAFGSVLEAGNHTQSCSSTIDCHKFFLAIGPTGDLYPCCLFQGHDEFSYGNIMDINLKDIANTVTWKKMDQRKEYVEKMCGNCAVYKYCYGGCPFNAYSVNKSINTKDYYCYSNRQFIIVMMNSLNKKMKSF